MFLRKKIAFITFLLLSSFLSLSFVSAACVLAPSQIQISSGSLGLGEIDTSNPVYIRSDLNAYPLSIDFIFNNTDAGCFDSESNIQFQLFPTGTQVSANSVSIDQASNFNYITTFSFEFDIDFEVTNSFSSSYVATNTQAGQSTGGILFAIDEDEPTIETLSFSPSQEVVPSGQEITFDYSIADIASGLASISISGGTSEIIILDGEKTFTNQYVDTPESTTTYSFSVRDKMGFQTTQLVEIVVDGDAPIISELTESSSYNGAQRISFQARVEDASFTKVDDVPIVIGNFASLSSSFTQVYGVCQRESDSTYLCDFNDIPIDFTDSKSVTFSFTLEDSLGNSQVQQFSRSIDVDKTGPTITAFFVENKIGVKNVLSPFDNSSTIKVQFNDPSFSRVVGEPRVLTNFDILTPTSQVCSYDGNDGECVFKLGDAPQVYAGLAEKVVTLEVTVVDEFGNPSKAVVDVAIDNVLPVINSIEVIETESIKDNVLQSQERITVRMIVTDENLFAGKYYVFGDFSQVDFDDGKENLQGNCDQLNTTSVQCDFTNINLENGYLIRNVTLSVTDLAGNTEVENFTIEVLKVGDEVVSSYDIDEVRILNPLNRNLLLGTSASAWFEGEIELKGDPQMQIVNYQLQSCNESDLDPLLTTEFNLYPNTIVVNNGQEDVDTFIMKVVMRGHGNANDLNTKRMGCTLALLKRDNTQVYPAELIDFNLVFDFYDTPRAGLLEANAEKILEMTEEIEYLGGWFDELYGLYSTMSSVCSVVSSGTGTMAAVSEAYAATRLAISASTFGAGEAAFQATDLTIFGSQGMLSSMVSDADSPVKRMCDFVTCRNGGLLGGTILNSLSDVAGTDLQVLHSNLCSAPAGFLGDTTFKDLGDDVANQVEAIRE